MNKTFRSLWSAAKQAWVAVAETVRACGKACSSTRQAARAAVLLGGLMAGAAQAQTAPAPAALPVGGVVSAGQASISQSGANMVIQQGSERAAINWQSFNVGSQAQVQFQQPSASSVTLNRVLSSDPSQIFGRITANGQVILTNPQGVYFGRDARVDVGGLIATTNSISDADFMAGKSRFERQGSTGRVVNEGELKAALGGYIALLAPEVRNQGAIIAQMGTVALAAGEAIDLKFDSHNRLTSLRVEPSLVQALVDNRHAVQAPGGLIILSAQSMDRLVGGVVRNSGRIEANGLQHQGGRIILSASRRVENTGTLSADATASSAAGEGGSAGKIEISAPEVINTGVVSATGTAQHSAGSVRIDTAQFTQTESGRIDLSAPQQGGSLSIQASASVQLQGRVDVSGNQDAVPTRALAETGISQGGQVEVLAQGDIELQGAVLDASGGQGGTIHLRTASAVQPDKPRFVSDQPGQGRLALMGQSLLSTRGRQGSGGTTMLLGDHLSLSGGTHIDASGAFGGGTVLVGGDWQGSHGVYQATTLSMGSEVLINASALEQGQGGTVVLWSDVHKQASNTAVHGTVLARGGVFGGNGGRVETSGHVVDIEGVRINAGADRGTGGLWLVDPYNYTIDATAAASIVGNASSGLNSGTSVQVDTSTSNTSYGGSTNSADVGDITVSANIGKTLGGDATLTLKAHRDINVSGGVAITSTSGKLHLVLIADSDNANRGAIFFNGSSSRITVSTNGGHLWMGGSGWASGGLTTTWNGLTVGNGWAGSGGTSYIWEGVNLNNVGVVTSGGEAYFAGRSDRYYAGDDRSGVLFSNGTDINTGAGNLTVKGELMPRSGTLSSYGTIYGVNVNASTLQASTGSISITGGEAATDVSYANAGYGVQIYNGTVKTTGLTGGAITITGTTGADSAFNGARVGVLLRADGNNAASTVSTVAGDISVTGTSNNTSTNQSGIRFYSTKPVNDNTNNPTISVVSRTGHISLSGDVPTATDGGNTGIQFNGAFWGKMYVGHDGTNAYSGNITLSGRTVSEANMASGYLNLGGSGALTIQPYGSDFLAGASTVSSFTLSSSYTLGSSHSAITLGKSASTSSLTLSQALTANGPVTLYGGDITLSANLGSSASGAAILLKAAGNITQGGSTQVSTSGGSVTYWSDSDGSGAGYIQLNTGTSANNTGISTSGGDIVLGGGSSNPLSGYAVNPGGHGVNLNSFTNLNAGSGAVSLRGSSGVTAGAYGIGVRTFGTSVTGGNVSLAGVGSSNASANGFNWGVSFEGGGVVTASGSLNITGTGGGGGSTGGNNHGILISTSTIAGTGSGAVTLTGTGGGKSAGGTDNDGIRIDSGAAVKSASGSLTLVGTAGLNASSEGIAIQGGSTIGGATGQSGAITLRANSLAAATASTNQVLSTGTLTIEPLSGSTAFDSGGFTTSGWTLGAALTGLTLGKSGNTAPLTVESSYGASINGPISLFGGAVALNAGLTSTNTSTGDVAITTTGLAGSGGVALATGRGLTVTQSGDSTYSGVVSGTSASFTKQGAGTLTLSGNSSYTGATTLSAGVLKLGAAGSGGNSPLGTAAGSITVASGAALDLSGYTLAVAEPLTLSGTGVSSSGALFNSTSTAVTYSGAITLAANSSIRGGSGALTLSGTLNGAYTLDVGTTNASFTQSGVVGGTAAPTGYTVNAGTGAVNLNAAVTAAGPISLYGGNLYISSNVSSTLPTAAVLFKATGEIVQGAGVDVTTSNGKVTYWSDSDGNGSGRIQFNATGAGNTTSVSTSGGDIVMGGGASDPLTGYAQAPNDSYAVNLDSYASLNAGTGAVSIRGIAARTDVHTTIGVRIFGGSTVSGGNITITGLGSASSGTLYNQWGVAMENNISVTASGTLSITGTGGGSNSTGGTNYGVLIAGSTVAGTGSGAVTITGTGGGKSAGGTDNDGIRIQNTATIRSASGSLTLVGTAGLNASSEGIAIQGTGTNKLGDASGQSGNITLRANSITAGTGSTNQVLSTGTLTIEPLSGSTSFDSGGFTTSGWTLGTALTGLTLGKSDNTAPLTVESSYGASINGPISLYGGDITLSANLGSSASGAAILVKAAGNITQGGSTQVSTSGGKVTYWSDSDGSGAGAIQLNAGTSANLTSIATSGGDIVLGGGNSDPLAGYAASPGAQGLNLNSNTSLNAGTGAVSLRGSSSVTGGGYGIGLRSFGASITGGNVSLAGLGASNASSNGFNWGVSLEGVTLNASGTLSITGTGGGGGSTGGNNHGVLISGSSVSGTGSGAVTLTGTGGGKSAGGTDNDGIRIDSGAAVKSASGSLTLVGTAGLNASSEGIAIQGGSTIGGATGQSGAITLRANSLAAATASTNQVLSTGTLTIEPLSGSTSFDSGGFTTSGWTLGAALTGLTLGKSGNTAPLTVESSYGASINGPISLFGGAVALNAGLTSTNTSTGDVAITTTGLAGSGGVALATGRGLTVTQSGDSTYSGVVSGTSASLTKQGAGTLTLSGNSSYTGATTVSAGTLVLSNNAPTTASSGFSGAGILRIEPAGSDFSSTFTTSGWTFGASLGGLSIGKATSFDGSSDVSLTVASAINIAGPITLYGGALALNGALTAGSGNIGLNASGAVTQTAALIAAGLGLQGAGSFTLAHASNNVGTFSAGSSAARTGALSFLDASGGLQVGTVATTGVWSTGDVFIRTASGNLTLAESVSTTSTSGTAIRLAAGTGAAAGGSGSSATGNLLVSGSPTVTAGTGATIALYSGSVSGSTGLSSLVGLGTGRFRYNTSLSASGTESAGYSTALGANVVHALYREQPSVVGTVSNFSITYGDALPSFSLQAGATGLANGDAASSFAVLSPLYSAAGQLRVGSYAVQNSNLSALGYSVSSITNGTLSVGAKTLSVTGLAASDKVYNAAADATLSASGNLAGVLTNDSVGFSVSASFNNKNVEPTKTLNLSYTLSGTDAGNYVLPNQTGVATSAQITPRTVSLSASKVYDGTSDLTGRVTITTGVGSETLTYTGALASDAHVATAGKYISALSLGNASDASGGLAANYQLPTLNAANAPVTITRATLNVTADAKSRVYGDDNPSFTQTITGYVNGENAGTAGVTGTATASSAATAQSAVGSYTITASIGSLSAANYSFAPVNGTLTVTARPDTGSAGAGQGGQAQDAQAKAHAVLQAQQGRGLALPQAGVPAPLVGPDAAAAARAASLSPQARTGAAPGVSFELQVVDAPEEPPLLLAVNLPPGQALAGTDIPLPLPPSVSALAGQGVRIQAAMRDGSPLPAWLRFDPVQWRLALTAEPGQALPLKLTLTVGPRRMAVLVRDHEK